MRVRRTALALIAAAVAAAPAAPASANHRAPIPIAHDPATPTVPGLYTGAPDPATGNVPPRTQGTYERRTFTVPQGEEHGHIRVFVKWTGANNIFNLWLYRRVGESEQLVQKQLSGSKPEKTLVTNEEIVPGEYVVYIDNYRSSEQNWSGEISFGEPVPSRPPVAILTPTTTTLPPGGGVATFDATESYDRDPGGSIAAYKWDLDGDGFFETDDTTGTQERSFTETGSHYVTVKVIDTDGRHAFGYAEVIVEEEPPPPPPPDADPPAQQDPPAGSGGGSDPSGSGGGSDPSGSGGGQDVPLSSGGGQDQPVGSGQHGSGGGQATTGDSGSATPPPAGGEVFPPPVQEQRGERPAGDDAEPDRKSDRKKAKAKKKLAKKRKRCVKRAKRLRGKRRKAAVRRCHSRYAAARRSL